LSISRALDRTYRNSGAPRDLIVGLTVDRREEESLASCVRQLAEGRHELAHDQAVFLQRRMGLGLRGRVVDAYGRTRASQFRNELVAISQETLAEIVGTTRPRVNTFMNKFRRLGFINYNGYLKVHTSLLSVALHD